MDDGRCPTFDILIEADTSYSASVDLDIESRTVTFTLGGEQKTVNITSDIFLRESDTLRAQARIAFGATGTIVGFVDNLTNSSNLFNTNSPADGTGTDTDGTEPDNDSTGTNTDSTGTESSEPSDTNGGISGGGGGCSISSPGSSSGFMHLMAVFSLLLLLRRKLTVIKRR